MATKKKDYDRFAMTPESMADVHRAPLRPQRQAEQAAKAKKAASNGKGAKKGR